METKEQKKERLIREIEDMTANLFFNIWISDLSSFKAKVNEYLEVTKEDDMWDKRAIASVFAVEIFLAHDCYDGPPCDSEIGNKAFHNLNDLEWDFADYADRPNQIVGKALDKGNGTILGIVSDDDQE